MLDFLRRRVAFPSGVDECNWRSVAVASGGKGSEPPAMVALDGEVRLVAKFRRPFSRKGLPRESAEVAQTPSQREVLALYGVTLKERAKGQANCVGGTPARSQTTLVENLGSRKSTDASGPEFIQKISVPSAAHSFLRSTPNFYLAGPWLFRNPAPHGTPEESLLPVGRSAYLLCFAAYSCHNITHPCWKRRAPWS